MIEIGAGGMEKCVAHETKEYLKLNRDANAREIISKLLEAGDFKTLEKIMCKRTKFGTGGYRGKLEPGFSGINEVTINILATTLYSFYVEKQNEIREHLGKEINRDMREFPETKGKSRIFIGYDGRRFSKEFSDVFSEIFWSHGWSVYLTPEPVITPYVSAMVIEKSCDIGIMITASHNPKEYNGVKVYFFDGGQIGDPYTKEIENRVRENRFTELKNIYEVEAFDFQKSIESYCWGFFGPQPQLINNVLGSVGMSSAYPIIVFSALYGPSRKFIETALRVYNLSGTIRFYDPECNIDPDFGGMRYPNPELDAVYNNSIEYANQQGARYIILTDPDGDRFGLAENTGNGWRIYSGDEIASLFIFFYFKEFDPKHLAFGNTFLCSDLMKDVSLRKGIPYVQSETGFKNLGKKVLKLKNSSLERVEGVFAYEDSLGFLTGAGVEKDAIPCAILFIRLAMMNHVHIILKDLRNVFGLYSSYSVQKRSINVGKSLENLIDKLQKSEIKYRCIGKRYVIEKERMRLIFRLSETEAVLKIYSHSTSYEKDELKRAVGRFIDEVFDGGAEVEKNST
jgi:phosphomannomutase